MNGERRIFVSMNEGFENITNRRRNGAATFTRRIFAVNRAKSQ
jgi:hypothetical protein